MAMAFLIRSRFENAIAPPVLGSRIIRLRAQGSGLKMAGFGDQTKSVNRRAQTGPFFTLFTNSEVFQEKLGLWRPDDAGVWGGKNIFT